MSEEGRIMLVMNLGVGNGYSVHNDFGIDSLRLIHYSSLIIHYLSFKFSGINKIKQNKQL